MPTRFLREGICTSGTINACTPESEVFFYRLLVTSDDFGISDGRLEILRSRCFPLKRVSDDSLSRWLAHLELVGLIETYSVNGRPYLSIKKWSDFQRVRNSKPRFPLPNDRDLPQTAATSGNSQTFAARATDTDTDTDTGANRGELPPNEAVAKKQHGKANGFELPAWVPRESWDGYVAMRVKIKAPLTPRGMTLVIGKLEELKAQGHDPGGRLDEATMRCWKGIFPPQSAAGRGGSPHEAARWQDDERFKGAI